jgi:hypothetical protein
MFRLDSNFGAISTVLHFWMEVDDLIGATAGET